MSLGATTTTQIREGPPPVAASHLSLQRGFELRHNEDVVPVSMVSQRLLAFLALRDRPVLRAHVGEALWLDSSTERAGASLRSALWRTPSPGGQRLIVATGTHLSLDPAVAVDFRTARSVAASLVDETGRPSLAQDRWAQVAGSLQADLLPDWYDDWVIAERERFRQLRLHALERLCHLFTEAGRYGEALDVGLAAVSIEPLRESGHRRVIAVHLAEGNPVEAIRQFHRFADLLSTELGVPPSPRIISLIAHLGERVTRR